MPMQKGIVLFDGVCNLCNRWVNILLKYDKKEQLQFASLQGNTAKELLPRYGLDPEVLNSIVFLTDKGCFQESTAVLEICKSMGFPWNLLYIFKLLPSFIRDNIYRMVARNRYRWFGKKETCRIPTEAERRRFLA